jgi:hypothetical protein
MWNEWAQYDTVSAREQVNDSVTHNLLPEVLEIVKRWRLLHDFSRRPLLPT